ncbi:MAG: Lrp/AsnC family transcriptional regulator [Thermoplasmataceae archaeon]
MQNDEMDETFDKYYDKKIVTALIGLELDVTEINSVINEVSKDTNVEDAYVVTGEFDILIKVRFPDYPEFQKYLLNRISKIKGVKDSKTMMVISIKKEDNTTFTE